MAGTSSTVQTESAATATESARQARREFDSVGYAVVRSLFAPDEVEEIRSLFEEIHRTGAGGRYTHLAPGDAPEDPLLAWPRVMNPHRFDAAARRFMHDSRIAAVLRDLFAEEPLAVQSMYYFKPPGSRGQAMHQDQFYLQVKPGTCVAAWIAMDRCDRRNGGMIMVPHTQRLPIDCRKAGKPGAGSYGANAIPIPLPDSSHGECPELDPGDAIFFNGSLLHGSGRNVTHDRWRRSFICHYVGMSCETISQHYHPLMDMSGRDVVRGATNDGGPCGGWVGAPH